MNAQLLALRDSVLAISTDLSLPEVLQRIVNAAALLADAQYAALGVPDETGRALAEFITVGLSPEERERISHWPRGLGLLGIILREGRSVRVRDIAADPRSVGFPPGHPVMGSFLGVPILYKGQCLGNLYLTNKKSADEFSEADQALIELLAAHAASAIQNARLYHSIMKHSRELEERNRELAALNAVAVATSHYLDLNRVMIEALDQVLSVSGAEAGEIFLRHELTDEMVMALHRGIFPEAFQSITTFRLGEGFPGQVALTGQPIVSNDLANDGRYLRKQVVSAGFKAYACIPLFARGKVVGSLDLAARAPGAFDESSLTLLTAIGHQIGVAVENARLYEQVAQLAVLEERQRIGMDLHDGVIQSIYAVGLQLEYIQGLIDDGEAANARERLGGAIDGLNNTIREIRSYILDMRPLNFQGDDLNDGLRRLAAEFKANTLVITDLELAPEANDELNSEARIALFQITQEALANVAKHAHANRVLLRLATNSERVLLEIQDNGQGLPPRGTPRRVGHGLSNMARRAQAIGAEFETNSLPSKGMAILVRVPKHRQP
ncbi:MAG: GAF domain-containing sensor histidine kinase [Chloroflexi bacterium]|nr:GAF domain-containing sensor histidine kinase [Chloroflexota bacterium]